MSSVEESSDGRVYYQLVREQGEMSFPISSGYDRGALVFLRGVMNAQAPAGVVYRVVKVKESTRPLAVVGEAGEDE